MESKAMDLFITLAELAELFGITSQGVHKQLKENNIQTTIDKNGRHKIYPDNVRALLDCKNLKIPASVIALHIIKGGVGKTTLSHGLAARASMYGLRTLMIDLDQQANLTSSFGIYSIPRKNPTIMDVMAGHMNGKQIEIQDAIVPITDYLHILPANLMIANLDTVLVANNENVSTFLEQLLSPVRDQYDLVFIDCPPSLSRVTVAAHCYANQILLPVNLDKFSIDGLELTFDNLISLQKKYKINPSISIVINKFDARQTILGSAVVNTLLSSYKEYLLESYVSISKQIDNSIAENKSIWSVKMSKNQALADINNVLIELLNLKDWSKVNKNNSQKESEVLVNG